MDSLFCDSYNFPTFTCIKLHNNVYYWQALDVMTCMKLYNKPFTKFCVRALNKALDMGEIFAGIKPFSGKIRIFDFEQLSEVIGPCL